MSTGTPLTPQLRARLQNVLKAAFNAQGLLQFATMRLEFDDVRFADEVNFGQALSGIAFDLVRVADQNGRLGELVLALQQERPKRTDVPPLVADFGLAPAVRAEAA